MSDKIFVVALVVARKGKEDALREALQALVVHTRTEPGFILYDLHESADKPGHFAFYEIWEDQASLDLHANTQVMKAHGAKTADWVESISVETYRKI